MVAASEVAPKPNIIVMFLDDHGWGDTSVNMANVTETPHMQSLAKEGIRFNDFHAGASVCTPSRAALLTGRYGLRTGVIANYGPNSKYGMASTEITLADMLNSAGYESHMIGKWHLGLTLTTTLNPKP